MTKLSRESALMVVGRRGHAGPLPHLLGSMARTLVRTTECPLMVVPV
ncbi:universal stress protein [Nocardioides caldifontis]|nr:universal stress protein [Nocardioides caldifontis]